MSTSLQSDRVEVANGNTRWMHNNGVMGFLKSDGNWDMYANNGGSVWTANYGWLHDYFFNAVSNCTYAAGNCSGNTGNCYNGPAASAYTVMANCGNVVTTRDTLEDGGSTINLRTYYWASNCNCNCACTCK